MYALYAAAGLKGLPRPIAWHFSKERIIMALFRIDE